MFLKILTLEVLFLLSSVLGRESQGHGTERNPLEITLDSYISWSRQIVNNQTFQIVHPRTPTEVLWVVNWAYENGKHVRVQGFRHNYPALTISEEDSASDTLIIDMRRHMKRMRMGSMEIPDPSFPYTSLRVNTVIAEPGATLEEFLTFAEENGAGVVMTPIIGDATLGGVLAIGGHGAGVPALKEMLNSTGYSFGSVSNFILELKAVVWSGDEHRYVIKTFSRDNPDISAFLVHIGRAIITEVSLMVGKNYNMRCISRVDISARELFAHPNEGPFLRTMTSLMDQYGRVDAIWYPFTESPWLKLWEITEKKPPTSKLVLEPYNYQFPINEENPQTPGPVFGTQSMQNLIKGLTETNTWDIWGPSKNTLLYYNGTSQIIYSGFVVLTSRDNLQVVINEIYKFYNNLLNEFALRGIYPVDRYIKLRATGLDDPNELKIQGAVAPAISPLSPSKPEFNIGLWMNTITSTGRPGIDEFMKRFEAWGYSRFSGGDALARPEWSKNFGHSGAAPESNEDFLRDTIPRVFGEWNRAVDLFNKYDPHQVISNRFLRKLTAPIEVSSFQGNKFGWGGGSL